MSKPYIERRYVELEEEIFLGEFADTPIWYARVDGVVTPNKERIRMSRSSKSAGEALLLLIEALEEQGYELR